MQLNYTLCRFGAALMFLGACSSPDQKMVGKWLDESSERQAIEVISVNEKPAIVMADKTFSINVEGDAMSVAMLGGELPLLYDADKDLLFLQGERYIREEKAQEPTWVGVYTTKDTNDPDCMLLSFDRAENAVTILVASPPAWKDVLPIREYPAIFKDGQLEFRGKELSGSGDAEHLVNYVFKYDHAGKKLVWYDKEGEVLTETRSFPIHHAEAGSIYAFVKDEMAGEWNAFDATFNDDGIEVAENEPQRCTITRTGKSTYHVEFHGEANSEALYNFEAKRNGVTLYGRFNESEEVELTLNSEGQLEMRSQYDDRLLKRQ
ncbi:MAG: hypothetical protein IPN38_07335 [Flavobacteriales bacterium]|nr:hypothetical protein [Flavobacteriales bacterium]